MQRDSDFDYFRITPNHLHEFIAYQNMFQIKAIKLRVDEYCKS